MQSPQFSPRSTRQPVALSQSTRRSTARAAASSTLASAPYMIGDTGAGSCIGFSGLVSAKPDDPERARALASSVMNLGLLDLRAGLPGEALPLLERAQSLRLAHVDVAKPSAAMQRDLGMDYYNLALA